MEQVDNGNSLHIEVCPEVVAGQRVVNVDIFDAQNRHRDAFLEHDLLLLWVGAVQGRVHSETTEASPVMEADSEENAVKIGRLGGIFGWSCEFQCNLEVGRGGSDARQANVAWIVYFEISADPLLDKLDFILVPCLGLLNSKL